MNMTGKKSLVRTELFWSMGMWYRTCYMLRFSESSMHFYSDCARNVHQFSLFLLRNGLTFFYGDSIPGRDSDWDELMNWRWYTRSLLRPLFCRLSTRYVPFVGGIARHLLVLGYGRREQHPAPLALLDENLDNIRRANARLSSPKRQRELLIKSLVELFCAGPLSLQQLAHIAIRRAVGGANFTRQINRLAGRIPLALLQYVADPTELMLSDDELYCRLKNDCKLLTLV